MNTQQYLYQGFTLIDITPTGVISYSPQNEHKRNQQRNWETVLQCIGLRSQPMHIVTRVEEIDLELMNFGEMYSGRQRVWSFAFTVEHADAFAHGSDPLALLHDSFDQVPIICGLRETARFMLPIFWTAGAIKNIYFKIEHFGHK